MNAVPVSQTAEYALRAVLRLAERPDQSHTTQQLAASARVPQSYLPKVLQPLARAGIVKAQRGSHGGYSLCCDAEDLTVQQVVHCVDPPPRRDSCEADDFPLCELDRLLDEIHMQAQRRYAATSIQDILCASNGHQPQS